MCHERRGSSEGSPTRAGRIVPQATRGGRSDPGGIVRRSSYDRCPAQGRGQRGSKGLRARSEPSPWISPRSGSFNACFSLFVGSWIVDRGGGGVEGSKVLDDPGAVGERAQEGPAVGLGQDAGVEDHDHPPVRLRPDQAAEPLLEFDDGLGDLVRDERVAAAAPRWRGRSPRPSRAAGVRPRSRAGVGRPRLRRRGWRARSSGTSFRGVIVGGGAPGTVHPPAAPARRLGRGDCPTTIHECIRGLGLGQGVGDTLGRDGGVGIERAGSGISWIL
jgi:hypothetical protein